MASIERVPQDPEFSGSSEKEFGLIVGGILTFLGILPFFRHAPRHDGLIFGGLFLITAGILCPRLLVPFNRCWTLLGKLLHRATSPIFLALIYFLAVTPTALIFKLLRRDPLRLRPDPLAHTYWLPRNPPSPLPESLKQQF